MSETTQPLNPLIDDLQQRESDAATALFDPAFPLSSRTPGEAVR